MERRLERNPCAHIVWTIAKLNAIGLAASQETDRSIVDLNQILQVQHQRAISFFVGKLRFQFTDIIGAELANHGQQHHLVRCASYLEHGHLSRPHAISGPVRKLLK